MTKPKKKAHELTTDEALHRLFGKPAAKHLRHLAEHGEPPRKPKQPKAKPE